MLNSVIELTDKRQSGLTVLDGLRVSWESVSGGNWKSAGRVVFFLLAVRPDLLFVVAACERETAKFK